MKNFANDNKKNMGLAHQRIRLYFKNSNDVVLLLLSRKQSRHLVKNITKKRIFLKKKRKNRQKMFNGFRFRIWCLCFTVFLNE